MAIFFLMRVGAREEIKKQFNEKYIQFSCPENWINLARKNKNNRIGDELECVFAHLPKGDKSVYKVYPGYPWDKERNGTTKITIDDKSDFYSWDLTVQTPTICFYSRDIKTEMENSIDGTVEFNLDEYCSEIGYNPKTASFLLIYNPNLFFKDLEEQLPSAIEEHKKIGDIYLYEPNKNLPNSLAGDYTKIVRIRNDEYFIDTEGNIPSVLRKIQREGMPNFEKLHEYRLCVTKYCFWQLDRQDGNYDFRKNMLKVHLPNITSYCNTFDGEKYSGVKILNYNPENNKYTIMGVFRKR